MMLLLVEWERVFSTRTVSARRVIEVAFEDGQLRSALVDAVPDLRSHPQPAVLTKFLAKRENLPMPNEDGATYRFARRGYRWALLPVEQIPA